MNESDAADRAQIWANRATGRDTAAVLSSVEAIRTACDDVLNKLTKGNFYGARERSASVVDAATQLAAAVSRVTTDIVVVDVVSSIAGLSREQFNAMRESIAGQVVHAIEGEVD